MVNSLLLLSGNDIPFEEAQLVIHPPKIKEIAYIGEDSFWNGVEFLNFSKNLLSDKDKSILSSKTDFEILLSVIQNQNTAINIHKVQMELVLTLLFPNYHVIFTPTSIAFKTEKESNLLLIDNNDKFNIFKEIISSVFCFDYFMNNKASRIYNPANAAAEQLAKKFKQRQKTLAKIKGQKDTNQSNVLGTYISVLAVGLNLDINILMNYTIFQLVDEFRRYQLKTEFDINMQARMAGATNIKEAENWMKNIYANEITEK